MPTFLHSNINLSGSFAEVLDPTAGQRLAIVRKHAGFWEAKCAFTGALLLPRVEHTTEHAHTQPTPWGTPKKTTHVSLGQMIQSLRAVLCERPAPATSPSQGA